MWGLGFGPRTWVLGLGFSRSHSRKFCAIYSTLSVAQASHGSHIYICIYLISVYLSIYLSIYASMHATTWGSFEGLSC